MDSKRLILLGVIAGLAVLTRTDNIFVVLAAFIWLFIQGKRVAYWPVIAFLLVISPWFIFNYLKCGTIMQSSADAYPWLLHNEFTGNLGTKLLNLFIAEFKMIGAYFGAPVIFLILIILMIVFARPKELIWAYMGLGLFLIAHVFIRWFPRIWYQQPLFIVCLLSFGFLLKRTSNKVLLISAGVILLVCSLNTITTTHGGTGAFMISWKKQTREQVAIDIIRQYVPAGDTIGAWNSGYLMYWIGDRNPCVNLDGLANNDVLQHYKDRTAEQYFDSLGIRWIVDAPGYFKGAFGRYVQFNPVKIYAVDNIGLTGNAIWLVKIKGN